MAKTKVKEIELKKENNIDYDLLKEELHNYIDIEIRKGYQEEINKYSNKLIKEKNKKIIFRNIIILILLITIGYLVYLLYNHNYFAKIVNNENITEEKELIDNEKKEDEKQEQEIIKEVNLDDLKKEYGYLIDNYLFNDLSKYKEDFYNGNLTYELKSYLTLNNMDFNNLELDNETNIINEDKFKDTYLGLFNDYRGVNFDYNGINIKYLNKISSYITDKILNKEKSNIVREIIDIKKDNNQILITCIEGKIINNNLYNILTDTEIDLYNNNLLKYQDKLNKIIYIFENNKLVNLGK